MIQRNVTAIRSALLVAVGLQFDCVVAGERSGSQESSDSEGATTDVSSERTPFECRNAEVIPQTGSDQPSGLVRCEEGFVHRVARDVTCLAPRMPDSPACAENESAQCQTAADCVDGPHGSCVDWYEGCGCVYGCETNEDCGEGEVCSCQSELTGRSMCVPADCKTDADCGDGLCGFSREEGCCRDSYSMACADPLAACHTNADCLEPTCSDEPGHGQCRANLDASGGDVWDCRAPGYCDCDCGRPFRVDGELRMADPVCDPAWSRPLEVPRELSHADAQRLAAHYERMGLAEHASVASFAKFVLQLLHLGAPPDLVREAQLALGDEVEHAVACFALASRYGGAPVGPGPLDTHDASSQAWERGTIVEDLVIEACVGETLAALEAGVIADAARDPRVRETMRSIADDELRHAQLGWSCLQWMLGRGSRELVERAEEAFSMAFGMALASKAAGSGTADEPGLVAHGLLGAKRRSRIAQQGVDEILRPLAQRVIEEVTVGVAMDVSARGVV